MEDIRERAIQLINGQARLEKAIKRCKMTMAALAMSCFIAGFAVGVAVPFKLKAVPVIHYNHTH